MDKSKSRGLKGQGNLEKSFSKKKSLKFVIMINKVILRETLSY